MDLKNKEQKKKILDYHFSMIEISTSKLIERIQNDEMLESEFISIQEEYKEFNQILERKLRNGEIRKSKINRTGT